MPITSLLNQFIRVSASSSPLRFLIIWLLVANLNFPDFAMANDAAFFWPIDCIPGINCVGRHFRIGYPDINGTGKAYSCGQPGYLGHQGTDIVVSSVEQGVAVLAAANGVVRWTADGLYDHCPDANNRECDEQRKSLLTFVGHKEASLGFNAGNYVVLEHKIDGISYLTLYAHLQTGSILTVLGQKVSRGEKIAVVGSSGNARIPHLHFGVFKEEGKFYRPVDPWKGPCNTTSHGLWAIDPPYSLAPSSTSSEEKHLHNDISNVP